MANIRRFFFFLCLALPGSFGSLCLHAQPGWLDTVNIPGYRYDGRFLIGYNCVSLGDTNLLPFLAERMRADYTYTYGGPGSGDLAFYRNPSLWDSGNAGLLFVQRSNAAYWLKREAYPVKAIYAPGLVRVAGNSAMSTENFYKSTSRDELRDFDTLQRMALDQMGSAADSLILFPTQLLNSGRFDPCPSPPCDVAIAGFPKYANNAMVLENADPMAFYTRSGDPSTLDDLDVAFVMQADEESEAFQDLSPADTIAYGILYRRDTTAQSWRWPGAPRCALFTPFDTVAITKGLYLDSTNVNVHRRADGFREFYFPVVFPTASKFLPFGSAPISYPCVRYDTTRSGGTPDTIVAIDTVHLTCHDTVRWGGDTIWHPYVPNEVYADWGNGKGTPYCDLLDSVLVAGGVLDSGTVNYPEGGPIGSDFVWVFHTTRRVRVDFLSGRFARHTFQLMQRGVFDSIIAHDVEDALTDPLMDTTLLRVGMNDEPYVARFAAVGLANARVARYLQEREPQNPRGTWVNPIDNHATCRLSLGDLDSVGYKPVQSMASQSYYFGTTIPAYYADPREMAWEAERDYYLMTEKDHIEPPDKDENNNGVKGDTLRTRYIMGPSKPDYDYYLAASQDRLGGTINKFAVMAGVSRTWFKRFERAVPYPVTGVVQVHGYTERNDHGYLGKFRWRPTTPEEISAQCWLALNGGIDGGLLFSDFAWEGTELGVINGLKMDTVTNYTVLDRSPDPRFTGPNWTLPRMWVGFGQRYTMVKKVVDEFKDRILPVYTTLDLFNGRNVCVHAEPDWSTVPMLAGVRAERVDANTVGANIPTGIYDAPDSTYLEAAIFAPTPEDTAGYAGDARYLVVTNRRLWPIAFKTYLQSTLDLLDSLAIYDTAAAEDYSLSDFGRIDVRRPAVVLKNSTMTMADSLIIEKVGYEGTFQLRRAFGDTIPLDYLNPGWGGMYRIVPIARGVSHEGTAFNNAVRSENPSTDVDEKPVMAVVERDSSVVLRTFDTVTGWTGEVMVSDAADTVRVPAYGRRRAHNSLPAIATTRDASATLVVWQRVDTLNRGTVEGLWIPGPPTPGNLAAAVRLRLSPVRLLSQAWMMMTPSVVGLEEGWVVAYGAPRDAIEVVALRNDSVPSQVSDLSLLKRVRASKIQFPARTPGFPTTTLTLDSTSMFPTLAYVPDTVPLLFTENPGRPVYLAWQQGGHDPVVTPQNPGPYIFSCRIDVEWNTGGRPKLYHVETDIEHVSQGLPGCSFRHPSIAADSTRIGVAFESRMLLLPGSVPGLTPLRNVDVITLRFRDSILNGSTAGARPWNTPAYYWGDSSTAWAYPSLTEFPAMSRASLNGFPQGGLAWFDQSDMRTQRFYRFGERAPAELPEGSFPTMTLSPSLKSSPMEKAGVLYRGSAPTAFDGVKGWGDTGTYYPSRLLTNRTGGAFDFGDVFSVIPSTGGIHSHFSLGGWTPLSGGEACDFVVVHGGILRDWPPDHEDDPFKDPPIGPGFFGSTEGGDSWIETTTETAELVPRTGVFTAGSGPVKIKRYIARTSNAVTWLNTFPYDTLMNSQPDVKVLTELVRASDGAVLWRDDTLSVRSMSTDEDGGLVPVPVDIYATPGTSVYIRLRPVTTMEMEYSLTGGYQFYEGYAAGGFTKVVSPRIENMESRDEAAAGLHLRVIPNPARERAEVRIRLAQSGRVRLSVYNSLGARVAVLPDLNAETAGEYSVEISLAHVRPGIYLLRGESEKEEAVVQFSVMK